MVLLAGDRTAIMFTEKLFGNLGMDMIASNDSEESAEKLAGGMPMAVSKYQTVITDLGKSLLQAARSGNTEKVHELMSRGAPFSADWLGTTPLHLAARFNHLETCKVLLRAGISKDSKTKVDRTPLHLAVYHGHVDVVELLLSNKCEVDARDMLKMTALHWAVEKQQRKIVEMLLQHGADPNVLSKFGKTPIQIATDTGQTEVLRLLQLANQMRTANSEQTQEATDSLMYELKQHKERHLGTQPSTAGGEHIHADDDNITMDLSNDDSISSGTHRLADDSAHDMDHLIEKEDSLSDAITNLEQNTETDPNNLDSSTLHMLKEHGIALMPSDDAGSLITSAIKSGRKIVLSEAGKFALKETRVLQSQPVTQQQQQQPQQQQPRQTLHTSMMGHGSGVVTTKPKTIKIIKKQSSASYGVGLTNQQHQQHQQQQQQQQQRQQVQHHVQQTSTVTTATIKTNKVIKILSAEEFKQICGGEMGSIKRLPSTEHRKTVTPTTVRMPIGNRTHTIGMPSGAKQINKVVMKAGHRIPVTSGGLNVISGSAGSNSSNSTTSATSGISIANGLGTGSSQNRHIITSADGVKRLRTATGMEIISKLPTKLPQDTVVSVESSPRLVSGPSLGGTVHRVTAVGGNSSSSSQSGSNGTVATSRMVELLERQILEQKKLTEDLRKQFELSQKQNEEYRARVDKLEKEVQKLKQSSAAASGFIEII